MSDQPAAIICDIDGTLALYDNQFGKGKHHFHRDFSQDKINSPVATLLDYLDNPHEAAMLDPLEFLYVSGRFDTYKDTTTKWMRKHLLPEGKLFMRSAKDHRKDSIIKKEIYDNYIKDQYNVLFVLDDRDQVVQVWRSLGLACFQVNYGNF